MRRSPPTANRLLPRARRKIPGRGPHGRVGLRKTFARIRDELRRQGALRGPGAPKMASETPLLWRQTQP
jgi:hypothetical protein